MQDHLHVVRLLILARKRAVVEVNG